MTVNLERIPAYFSTWVAANGNRGAVGEVAEWLANGGFETTGFDDIVSKHGAQREEWFREGMVDLVLGFANHCLTGTLSISDVAEIRLLRMLLHVDESAFYDRRPAEVSAFLQSTLDAFLADGTIDNSEDLYLVEVQAAFGLSYDQLLTLARPALERAFRDIELGFILNAGHAATRSQRLAKLAALEPTYRLAVMQPRTIGALY
jgi:hypothetical protein